MCAYLAHWAGAFPSHAFLPACCGFCLPPCAPIWPTGLAPFLLMFFSLLLVVAVAEHILRLFGPLGWRLPFSCFSPCLLWLLLATIRTYLAHWAGAFPSHAFLPACCGFCLPPCAPIWPTGLAPFLLMLFSPLVVAFACYHVRLFGPLGWRLSFSCFSPCLLWPLLNTFCAYLAHWAGAFPSHAFLPACCGFCLPPFAPIWPTGLAHFLLMLFSLLVVAFAYHHSRPFGPLGWHLSFSCFSPCLLWLLLADFRHLCDVLFELQSLATKLGLMRLEPCFDGSFRVGRGV